MKKTETKNSRATVPLSSPLPITQGLRHHLPSYCSGHCPSNELGGGGVATDFFRFYVRSNGLLCSVTQIRSFVTTILSILSRSDGGRFRRPFGPEEKEFLNQ